MRWRGAWCVGEKDELGRGAERLEAEGEIRPRGTNCTARGGYVVQIYSVTRVAREETVTPPLEAEEMPTARTSQNLEANMRQNLPLFDVSMDSYDHIDIVEMPLVGRTGD